MKKRLLLSAFALALLAAAGIPAARWVRQAGDDLPTVRVARGNLDLSVHTTGELRSARSAMVAAPPVAGTLQIVRLAPSGSAVKAGAVVVEFDPSEQEFTVEQSRSELEQAEQELVGSKAGAEVQAAEDQVALLKARFAVRRAELDLAARDLLGSIEVRKNELTLEESQRRLAQLQQDVRSKATSRQAGVAVLEAKRDKARLALAAAQQNIENMTVRSPIDGIVVLRPNMDASGGMYYSGMTLPEYRTGDMVWPGRMIAEVLDTSGIELQAKVDEADRANLNAGQSAEVRVDGLPGGVFAGTVRNVSGAAARGFFESEARRKFDTTLQLTAPDERLRAGLSASVVISGQQLKDVLYVPRQALFQKDGKPVVYARRGRGFEARPVTVKFRSESRAVIEGLDPGAELALVDPESRGKGARRPGAVEPPAAPGGAR
jgi:multidrug resistance efflux pump